MKQSCKIAAHKKNIPKVMAHWNLLLLFGQKILGKFFGSISGLTAFMYIIDISH